MSIASEPTCSEGYVARRFSSHLELKRPRLATVALIQTGLIRNRLI